MTAAITEDLMFGSLSLSKWKLRQPNPSLQFGTANVMEPDFSWWQELIKQGTRSPRCSLGGSGCASGKTSLGEHGTREQVTRE